MTTDAELSFDDQLDVLGDYRRRQLLFALLDREPNATVDPLSVDRLVDRRQLQILMRHVHLPMLEAAGVIAVSDEETVRRGPTFDQLSPLLRLLATNRETLNGRVV